MSINSTGRKRRRDRRSKFKISLSYLASYPGAQEEKKKKEMKGGRERGRKENKRFSRFNLRNKTK